jgi:myosin protein heavy chain
MHGQQFSNRLRLTNLEKQKARLDQETKKMSRQVEDSKVMITSLEKQKEKLSLSLEDLNHKVNREYKTSRNAKKPL